MKYDSIFVVLVLMVLVGLAPQSFAADDTFLKIEGVKGEVVDKAHQGEIDVLAWSWGGSQAGTTHRGTGGRAGKASIQDLSITKWTDSATPKFVGSNGYWKTLQRGYPDSAPCRRPWQANRIFCNDHGRRHCHQCIDGRIRW